MRGFVKTTALTTSDPQHLDQGGSGNVFAASQRRKEIFVMNQAIRRKVAELNCDFSQNSLRSVQKRRMRLAHGKSAYIKLA